MTVKTARELGYTLTDLEKQGVVTKGRENVLDEISYLDFSKTQNAKKIKK